MPSSVGGLGTAAGTRGWELWICSVVMVVLAGFFVSIRITYRFLIKIIGADDYIIVASLVSSGILSLTEIEAVKHGYGAHYETLTIDEAIQARKWFYGAQIAYKIVLTLNKMSICHMYYRVFAVSSRFFRIGCYVLQAIIVSSGVAFVIGTIWQCSPMAAFWNPDLLETVKGAWCFSQTPWWMSFSVVQILLDFALLGLPIKEVLKLQMTKVDKFGLILVFCTGLFVTFTSIYRATTLAASATNPDPTWGPIPATVWAVVEANSGIIAACLPLLRVPFLKVFGCFAPRTRRTASGTGNGHRYGQGSNMRPEGRSGRDSTDRPEEHDVAIGRLESASGESQVLFVGKDIYILQDFSATTTSDLND